MKNKDATYALAVLFAINTMNFFDRQIIAAVAAPISEQWHLTDTRLGLLSSAFIIIYAIVGVPFGIWADYGSRRKLLAFAVVVWSLFTAASGAAWSFGSMLVARLGVGVGEAGCAPAGNSLIGDLYPPEKRGRAIAVFMLGLPLGLFLSSMISGYVIKHWSWQWAFFLASIPGPILALFALRIKEPVREAVAPQAQQARKWRGYFRVLAVPTMWWIMLSGALHNFNIYAVSSFITLYVVRRHGLPIDQANYLAGAILVAGVLGLVLGGWAADWARQKSPRGRMLVASAALLISTPCIYLAIDLPAGSIVQFMGLMGFGWMMMYIYYVSVYPAIQDVVPANLRGSAMAVYFFGMYFLGGAYGTWVVGALSDNYAREAMVAAGASVLEPFRAIGLHQAFYVVPLVSLLLALTLAAGALTIKRDAARIREHSRKGSL